jgi:diguanylate cyclase (GGDEF)-like protein/PAS domain S-box-containing protein
LHGDVHRGYVWILAARLSGVEPGRVATVEHRLIFMGGFTRRLPRRNVTETMAGKLRPLGPEALDTALNAVLAEYPTAFVAAINADGVFVPMPASISLTGQQVLHARSMLDFVVSEDCERVISTWERARETGASSAQVRLKLDPGRPAVIHYLDARARHGVYVGMVVGGDAAALRSLPETGPTPPRITRVRKNEVAVFLEVDEATPKILGWTAAEMVGLRSLDFIHPEDQDRALETWMQMLSEPGTVQPPVRLRHRRSDGSWTWFEVTNHNLLADPDRGYVLAEMVDISDEMAAHENLRARMRLFTALAEFAAAVNAIREPERLVAALVDAVSAVVPTDTVVIIMLDRGDGRYRVRAVRGLAPGAVGAIIVPGDGHTGRAISERAVIVTEPHPRAQSNAALRDYLVHETTWAVGVPLINQDTVLGVISVGRFDKDAIFTQAELEVFGLIGSQAALALANAYLVEEVSALAIHDGLTGLYNRRHFDAALDHAIARFRRRAPAGNLAAIMFDLDHFGNFNRQHGHLAGDAVLRLFAGVLHERLRSADLVARYGGEEFIVILEDCTLPEVVRVAEEVRRGLEARTVPGADGQPLHATVSAGCAVIDPADPTGEALIGRADAALFMAKRAGRNQVASA